MTADDIVSLVETETYSADLPALELGLARLRGLVAGRHAAFSLDFCVRSRWRRKSSPASPR